MRKTNIDFTHRSKDFSSDRYPQYKGSSDLMTGAGYGRDNLLIRNSIITDPFKVSARVVDADGAPVYYAAVKVVGTQRGTEADEFGNFSIAVKPSDILEVSSLGFSPKTIMASHAGKLITLSDDVQQTDPITVKSSKAKKDNTLKYLAVGTFVLTLGVLFFNNKRSKGLKAPVEVTL